MSGSPLPADAFARVSSALLTVWPTVVDPASGPSRAEMGRVLDECGSDHRPLVDLLIDLGRVVRPALASLPPQTSASWVHGRAPIVHRLVSTRYLQADVARWAVDVWGQVLGVAPSQALSSPMVEGHRDASMVPATMPAASPPARHPSAPTPSAASARPPVLTPQQVPAAMRQLPSWAGGPVSFRVGQKPKSASLTQLAHTGRVVVRSTVPPASRFQPVEKRAAFVLCVLLVVITGGLLNAFRARPAVMAPVDARPVSAMATDAETTEAAGAGAGTTGAGATGGGVVVTRPESVTGVAAPIAAVVTAGMMPRPNDVAMRVRDTGVGGRYAVTQRVRDVSGSESCDAVAEALAAGRESEETVSHVAGQHTFTLVTRGVTGTLDADGVFISEPRAGTTNNVNWRFRMRGRFGPDGFTGESVTHTDAILRWGKIQTCVVTAELTGRLRSN